MNKKGFAIMPRELFRWGIIALYGLFMWFIYSFTKDWLISKGISYGGGLAIGLIGILSLLFLFKFKGALFIR